MLILIETIIIFTNMLLVGAQQEQQTLVTKDNCYEFEDCDSCLSGQDPSEQPCEWCAIDNRCHPYLNQCPYAWRAQLPFNCPVDIDKIPRYDENFAKRYALPMIASIYADDKQSTECIGLLLYLPVEDAIVALFRSAVDKHVLSMHFNFFIHSRMINDRKLGALAQVYYDAFRQLWNLMRADLFYAFQNNTKTQLWFFGHAFGGGLASIASTAAVAEGIVNSERVKLITFGQPRVTGPNCAKRHDKLVPYSFRIINSNDMLPSYPARMVYGQKKGPFHHRHEVWYPHGMRRGARYVVASMAEDGHASGSGINLSLLDNVMMFDKNLLEWWKDGCK